MPLSLRFSGYWITVFQHFIKAPFRQSATRNPAPWRQHLASCCCVSPAKGKFVDRHRLPPMGLAPIHRLACALFADCHRGVTLRARNCMAWHSFRTVCALVARRHHHVVPSNGFSSFDLLQTLGRSDGAWYLGQVFWPR